MDKKIDLIFDANIIASGANKACFRSGVYFASMNILKELLKSEILNVRLYCDYKNLGKTKVALKNDFEGFKTNIISNVPLNLLTNVYNYFLEKRTDAKNNDQKLKKFFYDLVVRFLGLFQLMQKTIHSKNLKNVKVDAYFSPQSKIPSPFSEMPIKRYTLLHDTIPTAMPEYHPDSKKGSWYQDLVESLNYDDYYFTNSEFTRQDFLKYFSQIDSAKITTTLLACSDDFKPVDEEKILETKKKYNIPQDKKYVFSLCTLEPRKNLVRAVKTFIQFIKNNNVQDLVFVLGGGHWKHFINILEKEISDLGDYQDKILKIGYVDDEDLPALYSGAEWFTYTSQYEGFGLPPLEAMSCGCPVIASNSTSLPEVVGDAGIMVDWDSDEQHIEAFEKYYFDDSIRLKNRQKGLERAKNFSWKKCADRIIDVIKK